LTSAEKISDSFRKNDRIATSKEYSPPQTYKSWTHESNMVQGVTIFPSEFSTYPKISFLMA
jgi:hypothetical protein